MDIRINSYTNFKSKAYPVKSFIIKTKHGRLNVSEVTLKDIKREGFFTNLAKFFCKNFSSVTKDPNWDVIKYKKAGYYDEAIKEHAKYYSAKIKRNNEDMTLLLVKDKRNKIQGACLSYGYDKIPNTKDTVCYIDSIAVSRAYRGFNIGKILIEKTMESAKNKFTDIFLAGEKQAHGFYKNLGFKSLSAETEEEKKIMDYISKRRSDYPKYVELFTKSLKESERPWYERIDIVE